MAALPRRIGALVPRETPPRAEAAEGVMAAFARMAGHAGTPAARLMADYASLALGPGAVSLADYERFRLYDEGFWGSADRRQVAGVRRCKEIVRTCNFRREQIGLAEDLLAGSLYLSAHGLPTRPILAIYRAGVASTGSNLLRTGEELRDFLTSSVASPLVARRCDGWATRTLFDDPALNSQAQIDRMVDEARDCPGLGWIFHPKLGPHPSTPRHAAKRLTPLSLLTMAGEKGVRVVRALWRLGGWDDVVASLDLKTGQAITIAPALAPERARRAPASLAAPEWPALKALAVEGGRLMSQLGLVAWQVAASEQGPVILDVDPTPDLSYCQLVDRRGLLEPQLVAFIAERRRLAAEWRRLEAQAASWRPADI
jgi:hypothetical protein